MARILNLPQKLQEIGRLRAGYNNPDKKSKDKRDSLDSWRFTSPNADAISRVAEIYGGDARPWADRDGEFEVFSTSKLLAVQLPSDAIFTAYEKWSGGGCQRRCDGERCVVPVEHPDGGYLDEVPCWCEEQNIEPGEHKDACSITVRLKVVLPDIPGLGVWMLTSASVYAAMELPAVVDLIDALRQRSGILIPCKLELQYREEKRAYEKFKRRYHVPTLHVDGSVQGIAETIKAIESRSTVAPVLPAGKSAVAIGPGAPVERPGLPAPRREPPPGPGPDQGAAYHPSYYQNLCTENNLDSGGTVPEMIARLKAAKVEI